MTITEKLKDMELDVFHMFDDQWALLTAGTTDKFNMMTISWGSLGTIWGGATNGKQIATVYVRPSRYTYELLRNEGEYFTISFFPKGLEKDLLYIGSRSGRDTDKLEDTKIHAKILGEHVVYEEAQLAFICRKLFAQPMLKENMAPEIAEGVYAEDDDVHVMFIGEIVDLIS